MGNKTHIMIVCYCTPAFILQGQELTLWLCTHVTNSNLNILSRNKLPEIELPSIL